MKNFIQPGHAVTVTAPANVASSTLVMVGKLFGIAVTSAASGEPVEIVTRGVFALPKINAQAWTQGAAIYWDAAEAKATTTVGSNVLIGHAIEAAANPSASGVVRLSI